MSKWKASICGLGLISTTACASVTTSPGVAAVAHHVAERVGHSPGVGAGIGTVPEIKQRIRKVLDEPLAIDGALEVALVNNLDIEATLAGLGVAHAELLRAYIIKNPTLSVAAGFPVTGFGVASLGAGVVQSLLDIFTRPLRIQLAEGQYARTQLLVTQQVLDRAMSVREAYFSVQAAQQLVRLRDDVRDSMRVAADLKLRQWQAGNISEVEYRQQEAAEEQAEIDFNNERLAYIEARERLNVLMGLWDTDTQRWSIAEPVDVPTNEDVVADAVESLAVSRRFDLHAAQQTVLLHEQALHIAQTTRFVGDMEIGVSAIRDAEGPRLIGPTLTLELPIFGRRQALIARLEAQIRESAIKCDALAVAIRSEVRTAAFRVKTQHAIAKRLQQRIVPLRQHIMELSQLHYNYMLLGIYPLLVNKQAEITVFKQSIEANRDYWIGQTRLLRAIGGRPTHQEGAT
jgi:cobalt-zinc-cadmium efflux system outer membrane protein